ncbi:hypothetical protein SM007_04500 [Streptomyces avermitilis]|uniref:Uncharacterized protein n=1 Tax=Streptomyces avermitilis (strain ATCC 31267 / DSM 46492 / JCM 5070 / NBRC 14893 / NCIMB 12804 / NRRL 8165 / MA-4680) TaxID=227882 RepID=Q82G65_STRAW|nr:hypothetical protein [Streptomyces sp. SID5469]OOV32134.1 hypothetical protein SM007_04500 [Streptomyces avermitilis]BAC71745.1 hypothetical protein SAVERM_4033 [Streptomyces avermitilis MA-4680 = NBRC 14893]
MRADTESTLRVLWGDVLEVSEVPERPEAADVPVSADVPVPAEAPVSADAPVLAEAPEAAPSASRRRGRTTSLIATAAVLGVVAGTCTGFLIQADREPTRLPSLSQPVVAQAKGKGPEPLSAARDRRVRTDGDLRELLLKRPAGARDTAYTPGHDGWVGLAEYAEGFKQPAGAFSGAISDEFRRSAATTWRVGSTYNVRVQLVQYRQEENLAAADSAADLQYWAEKEAGTRSWTVPGTGDGMAYVHTTPDARPGYQPVYSAEAHAWRGDIVMQLWVFDTKPIPKEKIMDLAARQMGRL